MAFPEEKTWRRWGVFHLAPWLVVGFFATEAEAKTKARELGPGHIVHIGKKQGSTDNGVAAVTRKPSHA